MNKAAAVNASAAAKRGMMAELTEAELQNMSAEQIAELQKKNCVFCHIITGRIPAKRVFEDDKCVAVLDINPANPGHVLLLPREHVMVMPQLPDDLVRHLAMVTKGISHACLRAFKAEGTSIFIANGGIAGQRAPHVMIHIIPRKEKDGVEVLRTPHKQIPPEQLKQVDDALKDAIDTAFGLKNPESRQTEQEVKSGQGHGAAKDSASDKDMSKGSDKDSSKKSDKDSVVGRDKDSGKDSDEINTEQPDNAEEKPDEGKLEEKISGSSSARPKSRTENSGARDSEQGSRSQQVPQSSGKSSSQNALQSEEGSPGQEPEHEDATGKELSDLDKIAGLFGVNPFGRDNG